jgi:glucose dehydrogenase
MRWIGLFAMTSLVVSGIGGALEPSVHKQSNDTDWALLGNSPQMQHHSDLAQINERTVGRLGLAWWTELPSQDGPVGNPLIQNGVVFQSVANGVVFANDVRTGKLLWSFSADYDASGQSLTGFFARRVNRGLAL